MTGAYVKCTVQCIPLLKIQTVAGSFITIMLRLLVFFHDEFSILSYEKTDNE